MSISPIKVFITGGTGVIGQALIRSLLEKHHEVEVLVRSGSESKISWGCRVHIGNPLDSSSYLQHLTPDHTFVQLVGVTHPNPLKRNQFRDIDLASGLAAVSACRAKHVRHLVYLSVAQPAPIMRAYIEVRRQVEQKIIAEGLSSTIVRPWYVLGPGRRWPLLLSPLYWLMKRFEKTRAAAERLSYVTLEQMAGALVSAIEDPPTGVRVWNVPDICLRRGN